MYNFQKYITGLHTVYKGVSAFVQFFLIYVMRFRLIFSIDTQELDKEFNHFFYKQIFPLLVKETNRVITENSVTTHMRLYSRTFV